MRKTLPLLLCLFTLWLLPACSNDTTKPTTSTGGDGTVQGQIQDTNFEFQIKGAGIDPAAGPFLLRGTNLHYSDDMSALVVDLSVVNRGVVAQHEPIGLTFIKLDPDGVTVLNPDNNIHDDGAAITFHFANNDNLWTPGEESLPRTVEFGVDKGTAIAFIARLDISAPVGGGSISGRVWNDANKDGVMQDTESGFPHVAVYLDRFTDNGAHDPLLRVATTDADGNYVFDNLAAGGYVVDFAPSTVTIFPTTPTEIHVLLTETDTGVSSYKGANFGGVPQTLPPPPGVGQHVDATGKFVTPDKFSAASANMFSCPDSVPQPLVTDPPINEDCVGGRLRGSVTEIVSTRNAFRVMATWVVATNGLPADLKVGDRLDVHVHQGPGPLAWVADSIMPWTGDSDEIIGRIDNIAISTNGEVLWLVLNTWITAPSATK